MYYDSDSVKKSHLLTFVSHPDVLEFQKNIQKNFVDLDIYTEKIKAALNKKDLEKKKEAKKTFEKINNKIFSIKKLSTENNELYGSVKPTEISKIILETTKLDIKPSMIQLEKEIKALGIFKIKINLHSEVQADASVKVVAAETVQ